MKTETYRVPGIAEQVQGLISNPAAIVGVIVGILILYEAVKWVNAKRKTKMQK